MQISAGNQFTIPMILRTSCLVGWLWDIQYGFYLGLIGFQPLQTNLKEFMKLKLKLVLIQLDVLLTTTL